MNLTIIGSGYVGLVTSACLADIGNDVLCIDFDQRRTDVLNNGGVPMHQPGLQEIIARNRKAGHLTFSTNVAAAVAHGDIQFIVVGRQHAFRNAPARVDTQNTYLAGAVAVL